MQAMNSPTSLVEIANQLSDGQPEKPEVVFVGHDDATNDEKVQPRSGSGEPEPRSGYAYPVPIGCTESVESSRETLSLVTIDPFAQEVGGEIPAMPTLPVISAQELTDQVVARESEGDHHAWRLLVGQRGSSDRSERQSSDEGDSNVPCSNLDQMPESFELETDSTGPDCCEAGEDCFYAYPGEVISIDGNQGFDHIDLRSYSIEDATFQPGAIVLHGGTDPTHAAEGEVTAKPITIRHRGVEFAVFSGDVRVEL